MHYIFHGIFFLNNCEHSSKIGLLPKRNVLSNEKFKEFYIKNGYDAYGLLTKIHGNG